MPDKPTNKIVAKFLRWETIANKALYYAYETALARLAKRKYKILFSLKAEREEDIKKSFRNLKHEIHFDEFTPENFKKYDIVMPLNMYNLRRLIPNSDLVDNSIVPTPTMEAIDICDDKYLFYTTLVEKGFENDMPRVGKNLKIPYIVKRKVAHMGVDCYVIDTPEKEKEHWKEINDPDFFCQEIVPGKKEYATHLIFRDGKMACALNVIYIFSTPFYVKGVDKFIGNKLGKCPHLDLFADMLKAINFEGICCFNYKEIDGKPYVFEINPRFGGSLSMFFFSFLRRL
ncbi:MAG: hypothetical protein JST50_13305 [Bacteroidetes bacterium]|jgi:predicted ATP-grasp superfamily ATP-dependent carboligase|nr:hypothetical protein [Bacteroidota bacterium]